MRASPWMLVPIALSLGCVDEEVAGGLEPPRDFTATPTLGAIRLAWRNDDDARTAVVRWSDQRVTDLPQGEALRVGRTFDDAVVIYVGEGDSFDDVAFDRCASYFYGAVTIDGDSGRRSEVAPAKSVLRGATVAPATAPPRSFDATFEDGGIRLRWDPPATPADHVRIVRREGQPVEGPDDGVIIATPRGELERLDPVVGDGIVPPIAAGVTYHYGAFACDACGRCETIGAQASAATPVALGDGPTDLTVEPNGSLVDFRWSAPTQGGAVTMRLVKRDGAPVEGPDDPESDVVYEGPDAEAHVAMTTFLPEVDPFGAHYHFAVYACVGGRCSAGASAERGFTLAESLRGGGYVVYFAHAEAGVCVDRTDLGTAAETTTPDWWKSCVRSCDVATAEQLSSTGYEDAEAAGRAMRDLGLPFDRVLTSEYCRAVETAERLEILDAEAIATRPELTPFVYGTEDDRCRATLELVAGAALGAPDHDAAIVGHGGLGEGCAALGDLAPGAAAILRPSADGPILVTRLSPQDWGDLP